MRGVPVNSAHYSMHRKWFEHEIYIICTRSQMFGFTSYWFGFNPTGSNPLVTVVWMQTAKKRSNRLDLVENNSNIVKRQHSKDMIKKHEFKLMRCRCSESEVGSYQFVAIDEIWNPVVVRVLEEGQTQTCWTHPHRRWLRAERYDEFGNELP